MQGKAQANLDVLKGGSTIKADDCWIEPDETCTYIVYEMSLKFQNYTEEKKGLNCFKYHYNVTFPTSANPLQPIQPQTSYNTTFVYWN